MAVTSALRDHVIGFMMWVASSPIITLLHFKEERIHEEITFNWDASCTCSRSHAG
jgi:hypothetical protein